MSFRRFVNLVSCDSAKSVYSLRRINISGLFLPTTTINNGGRVKDGCCLPKPAVNFCSSHLRDDSGDMAFHLLDNKVVATDTTGGAFLYDPNKQAVRALPSHEWLKNNVISHAVGNNLYIMDRLTNGSGTRSFEVLVFTPSSLHGSWHWETLLAPPPPPGATNDHTSIDSFASVDAEGSKIWVSATGSGNDKGCTHLYDAAVQRAWSKEPADWVLPFSGSAQYVHELNKLWFGISSKDHGRFFCAADLSRSKSQPPALHAVLEHTTTAAIRASGEWDLVSARAIYLGSGKFCVANIFATPLRISTMEETDAKQFAVMAGVEVTTSSSDGGRKVLTMVERNSERYVLNVDDHYWVL